MYNLFGCADIGNTMDPKLKNTLIPPYNLHVEKIKLGCYWHQIILFPKDTIYDILFCTGF